MLFMPGNNPGMLVNGSIFGADSVIFDLEDAVSPKEKDGARILVRNALKTLEYGKTERVVRINALSSPYWEADLKEIVPARPAALLQAKVESAKDVLKLHKILSQQEEQLKIPIGSIEIIPLIETALGIKEAFNIASSSQRVKTLFLGAEDLTADLQAKRSKKGWEIFYSRSRLVVAARSCGKDVIDTPFTDVNDLEGLERDTRFAKELGFSGKAAISPRHISIINNVFSPSESEIKYAQRVLETIEQAKQEGRGVVALDGKMIDAPVVARSQQVLTMVKYIKAGI